MNNKKLILIIEDEVSYQRALIDRLNQEGFTVVSAMNGKDGLDIALEKHPDLIILDIAMPKMDGIEMLKILRKDEWGKKAHVIVLTVFSDTKHVADVMLHDSFEYFVKTDIKIEDLVNKIKGNLKI